MIPCKSLAGAAVAGRAENLKEAVDEARGFNDGVEQQEALAGLGMTGKSQKRVAKFGVAMKALGSIDEPEVELVVKGACVAQELGVVAFGVVDQVARMDLEEFGEQGAGLVGEVRAGSALDLGEIALAHGGAGFGFDGAEEFLLCHRAVETTEVSFHFTEVAEFFTEFHQRGFREQYCNPR